MPEEAERIFTRILDSLETHLAATKDPSRIVALCGPEHAIRLAQHLRERVIVYLPSLSGESPFSPRPSLPNLELLSCGIASAHFLPQSVSAVVAIDQDAESWAGAHNFLTVAEWLRPGGVFCLDRRPVSRWKEWRARLSGTGSDLLCLAQSVGLQREDAFVSRLQIWRKA